MMPDPAQLVKHFLWLLFGIGIAFLLVYIAICFITMKIYSRIPEEYRELNPVQVWLLLVPCFNFIWMFFVFPRLATSLKNYFNDIGDESVGDCGRSLAVVACLLAVLSVIFPITFLSAPVSVVCFILFLVKANALSRRISEDT